MATSQFMQNYKSKYIWHFLLQVDIHFYLRQISTASFTSEARRAVSGALQ